MHTAPPDPVTHIHPALAVLAAVVLAVALSACSGGDDEADDVGSAADPVAGDTDMTEDADGDGAADEDGDAAEAEGSGEVVAEAAETDLGEVLVDADGLTLYGFTNDSGGTSSCTDDCAATWPPLTVEEGYAVADGLDPAVFTTTERDDGTLQLVAGDWPLYLYAADSGPGDVNGQGVGDVWFVVDPSGELVRDG